MPQKEIDTGGYEIKGLKKAAALATYCINNKFCYSVYYSIFTHKAHIVCEGIEPDPDWIQCEGLTPYVMSQQAIADCIVSKLEKIKASDAVREALRKVFDGSSGK